MEHGKLVEQAPVAALPAVLLHHEQRLYPPVVGVVPIAPLVGDQEACRQAAIDLLGGGGVNLVGKFTASAV